MFNEYVIENKISGKSVRNEISKSILFLEKYVKIPMKNFIGPGTEINVNALYNKENTLEKFQKKIKNIISNKNNNNISNNNNFINNYPIIQFTENEFKNIFETEKNLLNIYKILFLLFALDLFLLYFYQKYNILNEFSFLIFLKLFFL